MKIFRTMRVGSNYPGIMFSLAMLAVGFGGAERAVAAEFVGAAAVIAQARDAAATGKEQSPAKETMEGLTAWARRTFKELPKMEPPAAAAAWLEILVTYWTVRDDRGHADYSNPYAQQELLSDDDIFANLPGPDTWSHLQKLVKEQKDLTPRRQAGLEIFTAKLLNDQAGIDDGIAAAESAAAKQYGREHAGESIKELREQLAIGDAASESAVARFEKELLERKKQRDDDGARKLVLRVPDLALLTDDATARRLLLMALSLPDIKLEIPSVQTLDLARRVALDNMALMTGPRWDLMGAPGVIELYEATRREPVAEETTVSEKSKDKAAAASLLKLAQMGLGKRDAKLVEEFLEEKESDAGQFARAYYFVDLWREGRTVEAEGIFDFHKDFISGLQDIVPEHLGRVKPGDLYALISPKMDAETSVPLKAWRVMQTLARLSNNLSDHADKLEKALAGGKYAGEDVQSMYTLLADAHLALDQPEKAVEALKQRIAIKGPDASGNRANSAERIIRLGEALDKPEWVALGIDQFRTLVKSEPAEEDSVLYFINMSILKLVPMMVAADRGAEAEQMLLEKLSDAMKSEKGSSFHLRPNLLKSLVLVYDAAGRAMDVMTLLDDAPWWQAEDVAALAERSNYSTGKNDLWSSALGIARALQSNGHEAEAISYLKRCIIKDSSADELYEALIGMTGDGIIPWLDELTTRDRFEERPFIWKAVVLHRSGRLDEAEAAARRAMEIDPTDGEARRGRRLFAYQVLADILADKNEMQEAEKLRKVVAAVRLAEKGDELNDLSLADRAVKAYDQASRDFSDAYCVEWRLARRLHERGEDEAATRHYQKAFELMPEQFGQLSNLCFGCENIFELEKPQSIAEQVLQRMAKEPVVKPTVYHLLGQLREAQHRYTEAVDYYRKAVEVEPTYFDAWESLSDVAENAFLSNDDRTSIARELMKLDPHMKHYSPSSQVSVPADVLWYAGERERKWMENMADPIYPLAASKAFLEQARSDKSRNRGSATVTMYYNNDRWKGPAKYLAESDWIREIRNLMY